MTPFFRCEPAGEQNIALGSEAEFRHHRSGRDALLARAAVWNEDRSFVVALEEVAPQIFADHGNLVRVTNKDIFCKPEAQTGRRAPFVALMIKSMNGD